MQGVELERFSLLIDSGLAWLRLSAEMGCVSSKANDHIFIEIDYLTEEEVDITSVQLGKISDRAHDVSTSLLQPITSYSTLASNSSESPCRVKQIMDRIPVGIRELHIYVGTKIDRSDEKNTTGTYCVIDQISLSIFKQGKDIDETQ